MPVFALPPLPPLSGDKHVRISHGGDTAELTGEEADEAASTVDIATSGVAPGARVRSSTVTRAAGTGTTLSTSCRAGASVATVAAVVGEGADQRVVEEEAKETIVAVTVDSVDVTTGSVSASTGVSSRSGICQWGTQGRALVTHAAPPSPGKGTARVTVKRAKAAMSLVENIFKDVC